MKVIVVANHKGGAGKTTLTSHLAVEAERSGAGPVAIMDLDSLNGLARWWNARKAETPLFAAPLSGGLAQDLCALEKKGVELVFIDTPPAIDTVIATAITVADLLLIPTQPSPIDLRVIVRNMELLMKAKTPMVFVINFAKSVRMSGDTATVLSQYGTVAINMISNRTLYASSMIDGRTAPELDPTGAAAREIARLWTHVNLRLHERQSMEKPASLGTMAEESAGLVRKGEAVAVANAALLPPVAEVARPRRTQSASPPEALSLHAGHTSRLSSLAYRVFEERKRRRGGIPVELSLNSEMYERLRRMAFELRMPVRAIMEIMLVYFMDEYESSH